MKTYARNYLILLNFTVLFIFNFVFASTSLHAAIVSFEFDATVTHESSAPVLVGQTGTGRITYDSSEPLVSSGALHGFECPPAEFTFNLAGMSFIAGSVPNTPTLLNTDILIDLRNDQIVLVNKPPMDAVLYWGNYISQKIDNYNVRMVLALHDSTSTTLKNTSVPTSPPNLSDFDITSFQIQCELAPGTWIPGISLSVDSIHPAGVINTLPKTGDMLAAGSLAQGGTFVADATNLAEFTINIGLSFTEESGARPILLGTTATGEPTMGPVLWEGPDVTPNIGDITFTPNVPLTVGERYFIGVDYGFFTSVDGDLIGLGSRSDNPIPDGRAWRLLASGWDPFSPNVDIAARIFMSVGADVDIWEDDFNDGITDRIFWRLEEVGDVNAEETSGYVEVSAPTLKPSGHADLISNLVLDGDFDVWLDYDWVYLDGDPGARWTLHVVSSDGTEEVILNNHRWNLGNFREIILHKRVDETTTNVTWVSENSVPLSGSLRIQRVGATINGYYRESGGNWILLGETDLYADKVHAYFRGSNSPYDPASSFTVHLDNFHAEASRIIFPEPQPMPWIPLLLLED